MDLKDLIAWTQAIAACDAIYGLTATFPKNETYGLTSQVRRAIVSVASNIAEGEGRLTKGERRQAISNARGSLYEARTQLEIARRLGYCGSQTVAADLEELQRTLDGYIAFVRRTSQHPNVLTSQRANPSSPPPSR